MRDWINIIVNESWTPTEYPPATKTLKDGRSIIVQAYEEMSEDHDEERVFINVYAQLDGKTIGSMLFDNEDQHVRGVSVNEKFRRLGVATALYDYLDGIMGYPIRPSQYLEPDGEAFWANRRK